MSVVGSIKEVANEDEEFNPKLRSTEKVSSSKRNEIYKPIQKVFGSKPGSSNPEIEITPDDPMYSKKCYVKNSMSNIFNNKKKEKFNNSAIIEAKKNVAKPEKSKTKTEDKPKIYTRSNHKDLLTGTTVGLDIVTNQPKTVTNNASKYKKINKSNSTVKLGEEENNCDEAGMFLRNSHSEFFTASSNGLDIVSNLPKAKQNKLNFKRPHSTIAEKQTSKKYDPDPSKPFEKNFLKNSHSEFFTNTSKGVDIVTNIPKPIITEVPKYCRNSTNSVSKVEPKKPKEINRKKHTDILTANTKGLNIITNEPKIESATPASYKRKAIATNKEKEKPLTSRNRSTIQGSSECNSVIFSKHNQQDLFTGTTKGLNIVTNKKLEAKVKLNRTDKNHANLDGQINEIKIQFDPKETDIECIKNIYHEKGINIFGVTEKTELVRYEHEVLTYYFKTTNDIGDIKLKVPKVESKIKAIETVEKRTVVPSSRNNDLLPARADWTAAKKLKESHKPKPTANLDSKSSR